MKLFKKRLEISGVLYTFLKVSKGSLIVVIIGKAILIGLGLLMPVFNKMLIDEVLLKQQMFYLKWIVIGCIATYCVETLIMYMMRTAENKLYYKTSFLIKDKLWRSQLYTPIDALEKEIVGEQKNRLDNDMLSVENFLVQQMISSFVEAITVLSVIVLLLKMNVALCLFGLVVIPLSFKMTTYFGTKVAKSVENYRVAWGSYEDWISEYLTSWKEVKALHLEKQGGSKFIRYWKVLSRANFEKWMNWFANANFVIVKDTFIVNLSIYFVGAILIFYGKLTVGSLLVFKIYYEKMIASLNKINELDMNLYTYLPGIGRVLEKLKPTNDLRAKRLETFKGNLKIKNIDYMYEGNQYLSIKNISLTIKQGEHIAIVGPSGCGKSTFIKLLLGIYTPTAGSICVDETPLEQVDLKSYYRHIGIVSQDFRLFNMSIEENLKLVAPKANTIAIEEACKMAHIWEEIKALPEGIQTQIGEGGEKLSVGQRQRLCLARAFLKKPSLLILDEATSALDSESEKAINEVLKQLNKEITVLVIAHRATVVETMSRVIILEQGEVVGDDAPEVLGESHMTYRRIFAK